MTLLRQIQERSSRDSICDAITLISDKYKTLYAESLRTTTAKEHIRQIARVVALRQNSPLQSTAPDSRLCTITHLARRKMQCNYNPKTRLRNNDGYAKAVVYIIEYKDISSLNYTQFIQTLKREVRFEDKRSSIYYYTKTADTRWHSALQDIVVMKLYRATFVIKLLI
ncbi:hypothetical protein HBI88_101070 [Parastagonospora nodorum]|nr:hypothetical protein HBI97_075030 [Parastagonospora nodorum]KAH5814354.1 hypothetical protein HBI96_071820 [Parastagonospora nodorum]KAH5838393.1 hypothetical protein HBI93_069950 [Parastagonospora nodorum]KAH5846344.1 hypothetical protein HBI90_242370 [Parastagonospora nodorum]KAH5883166.1 hypothetical protein HBI91_016870 [Parastagonospora nodorum]